MGINILRISINMETQLSSLVKLKNGLSTDSFPAKIAFFNRNTSFKITWPLVFIICVDLPFCIPV